MDIDLDYWDYAAKTEHCDWQDNECHDEPLSDDILETSYDGDGI